MSALKARPKIKPPRKPEQPQTDTFDRLSRAIAEIQSKRASRLSFEEHYRYSYQLVLHKQGDLLYDGISDIISKHLQKEAATRIHPAFPSTSTLDPSLDDHMLGQSAALEGEKFLSSVVQVYDDHIACMSKLKDLLKYMDKVYVTNHVPPRLPTFLLGLSLFLKHIIRSDKFAIGKTLLSTMIVQIRLDRQGKTINKSVLRMCVQIYNTLKSRGGDDGESIYRTDFEQLFLAESRSFYTAEAARLLATGSAPDYLAKVQRRLQEEDERLRFYLHHATEGPLVSLLDHILIEQHLDNILSHESGGMPALLTQDRVPDLKRLYQLLNRVGSGPKALRKSLKEWIVARGLAISETTSASTTASAAAEEEEDDLKGKGKAKEAGVAPGIASAIAWVTAVLELKDKVDRLYKGAFESDLLCQTAITEAFERFINQQPKSAEYISLFLDDNLRKGLKGKTEAEVDVVIDKAITIFRFIADKDVFETFYRRHLARRLILQRSVSDDAERGVLAKLKVECGASFVRDLEGMIKDVKLSSDLMIDYKKHIAQSNADLSIEVAVQVCTSSHWPIQQPNSKNEVVIFPEAFTKSIKSFESFYMARHSGRKLSWRGDYGSVDVKVQFYARKHELNITTQCMLVLSLFEALDDSELLSYQDIATSTAISDAELRRTLQSLACGKYRILVKEPKGREVNPTDKFHFNSSFTSPLARIKIQQIANRVETVDEGKDTRNKIEDERKLLSQACIVRVMKDRKTMQHVDLVNEVTRQLASRFQPKPAMIKQQIEIMLEREYLERDTDNRKLLRYLA